MTTDLALPGRVTEIGLDLSGKALEYEEWERAGQLLGQINRAVQWWVGDWLAYGERIYGEEYAQGIEMLGYSHNTLRNWQWVSERIPMDRRTSALDFSHHQAVAGLPEPEQDRWLRLAFEHGWSVAELKRQIKGEVEEDEPPAERWQCPHCRKPIKDWLLDHGWQDTSD